MKTSLVILSSVVSLLAASSASAVVIAQQTFDTDQSFDRTGVATYANGISTNNSPAYTGSGLGFTAAGYINQAPDANRFIGPSGGVFRIGHMSNVPDRTAFDTANTSAQFSTTAFNLTFGSWSLYDTVDLTGFIDKTFTVDLADIGTNDTEENFLVRLYLNGSTTGTDIYRVNGSTTNLTNNLNASASFSAGTLSYSFADTDTSARLMIITTSDDDGQGYTLDNVSFNGTAVPEPSAALLGAFGALALLRRRR